MFVCGFGSRHSRIVVDNGEVKIYVFLPERDRVLGLRVFTARMGPPLGVSKPWISLESSFTVRVVNAMDGHWIHMAERCGVSPVPLLEWRQLRRVMFRGLEN